MCAFKTHSNLKQPATELRPPSAVNSKQRILCALVFASAALFGVLLWRAALTFASSQWWFLWPLVVLVSAAVAALRGPSILCEVSTKSAVEAFVRALLIFSESVVEAVLLSMFFEAIQVALAGDAFGGLLKLMLILPYGPWNGIVAAIFSLWLTTPLAVICGVILYKLRQNESYFDQLK